jgi:hypothetical protein
MRLSVGARRALALLAFVGAGSGCTQTSSPPGAAPTARAATRRAPAGQASAPARAETPLPPAATPVQPAAAGPVPPSQHVRHPDAPVLAQPHDRPVIYSVVVLPTSVGAGQVVAGSVTTSSNVASVVATVAGISAGMPKIGIGRFALTYKLPDFIPPTFRGKYPVTVVARNVDGVATSRVVELTLR